MPHSFTQDDYRAHILVYALIQTHLGPREELRVSEIHSMIPRYRREIERCGVEFPAINADVVSKRYREVDDAIYEMMCYLVIDVSLKPGTVRVLTTFDTFLIRQIDYSQDEIEKIKSAAKITCRKFRSHQLDDDLAPAS